MKTKSIISVIIACILTLSTTMPVFASSNLVVDQELNRTFALPEMEKKKSREREYIEWSNVNVSTVNGDINYDEYFRLAD